MHTQVHNQIDWLPNISDFSISYQANKFFVFIVYSLADFQLMAIFEGYLYKDHMVFSDSLILFFDLSNCIKERACGRFRMN